MVIGVVASVRVMIIDRGIAIERFPMRRASHGCVSDLNRVAYRNQNAVLALEIARLEQGLARHLDRDICTVLERRLGLAPKPKRKGKKRRKVASKVTSSPGDTPNSE